MRTVTTHIHELNNTCESDGCVCVLFLALQYESVVARQVAAHAQWKKVCDVKVMLVVHQSALTNVKHCRATLQQLNDIMMAHHFTTPTGLAAVQAARESCEAAELAMRKTETDYQRVNSLSQQGCDL